MMKALFDRLRLIAVDMDDVTRATLSQLESMIASGEKTKGQQYEHLYDVVESYELKSLLSSLHGGLWSFCNYLRVFERNGKGGAYLSECGNTFARLKEASYELCESFRTDGLVIEIDEAWKGLFGVFGDEDAFIEAVSHIQLDRYGNKPIIHVVRRAEVEEGSTLRVLNLRWIGAGSFANIFAFDDSAAPRGVALKVAKKESTDVELKSFRHEYRLTRMVESENVLKVFDYADNADAYVMELMDNSLEDYVLSGEYCEMEKRIVLLRQLLTGIEDINEKGILHRDLSPNNILVKFDGNGPTVKVSDFGLAIADKDASGTWGGDVPGLFNDKTNLGCIGFENYGIEHETYAATLLALFVLKRCRLKGHQGYNDKNDLKGPLRSTILKGLREDPTSRYHSISELSDALEMVYPLLLT